MEFNKSSFSLSKTIFVITGWGFLFLLVIIVGEICQTFSYENPYTGIRISLPSDWGKIIESSPTIGIFF